jgi:hypothetical protein
MTAEQAETQLRVVVPIEEEEEDVYILILGQIYEWFITNAALPTHN